jgi:hypothetical protein
VDDDQLARFGLHNGKQILSMMCIKSPDFYLDGDDDETLLDAKWEGFSLAPVGDEENPNDYFLFTAVSCVYFHLCASMLTFYSGR